MDKITAGRLSVMSLRAEFTTDSPAGTRRLAQAFAPVVSAVANHKGGERLRLGLSGRSNSGKTPFAESLIESFFPGYMAESYLNGMSHFYIAKYRPYLAHYDNAWIKTYHFGDEERPHTAPDLLDFNQHSMAVAHSNIHVVEWPELDEDKSFDCLWSITHDVPDHEDPEEPSARRIAFYCTDAIAALPEMGLIAR